MDILIACQCEASHNPVYITDASKKLRPIKDLTADELLELDIKSYRYMDVDCKENDRQYVDWSSIPNNSMDVIYLMNCSVYPQLRDQSIHFSDEERGLWTNLMDDAWRILRPRGKIIIPPSEGPYFKRDSYGKIVRGEDGKFQQLAIKDGAEYEKDNINRVFEKLESEYKLKVPSWKLSTISTFQLRFLRFTMFSLESKSPQSIPKKHIVLTKIVSGGKKRRHTRRDKKYRRNTRKA